MTTNGHSTPFPTLPPEPKPRPEPTRKLMVATWDGDTLLELEEATDVDLIRACERRGIGVVLNVDLNDQLRAADAQETERDTEPPPAEVKRKLPSARAFELEKRREGVPPENIHPLLIATLTMLDERIGPAKSSESASLRSAVEARMGKQFHSVGDAAMAKVEALILELEERL